MQMAADLGYCPAIYELGVCYETGRGVTRNEASAAACFRQAAENDHYEAQVRLGLMYERGLGVAQNTDEAIRWYRRAAAQKTPAALQRLEALGLRP
jgi:hypothetical protein